MLIKRDLLCQVPELSLRVQCSSTVFPNFFVQLSIIIQTPDVEILLNPFSLLVLSTLLANLFRGEHRLKIL